MQSRRNGDFKRSVISALAAMVAAAVPSLIPSTALAEKLVDKADETAGHAKGAQAAKGSKKAQPVKSAKPAKAEAKPEAKAKPAARPAAKAKPVAAAPKAKKAKKTASREASARGRKTAKKGGADAPTRRCLGEAVWIDRGGLEGHNLALVDCHRHPLETAQKELSVLARPWGAKKPGHLAAGDAKNLPPARPGEIAPGVKLVDRGLLARLDTISRHFQGHPISVVSGYRPQSRGSLHQHARALDFRIAGVSNEDLVAFCRTLPDTGCGYYPNSSFVHVDVRNKGTGKVTWIDASGPGESPRYVRQWPLPADESDQAVLADEAERHTATDPWELDPSDEHAAGGDGSRRGPSPGPTFPDLAGVL